MNLRRWLIPVAFLLLGAGLVPAASAHTAFLVANKYSVKVGWLNEPPTIDQSNAITVEIRDTTQKTDDPEGKLVPGQVANIHVTVTYGGSSKDLELDASDETPGLYFGGIIPTVEGIYTVAVTGKIESSQIPSTGNSVKVDKVEGNDAAFPKTYGSRTDLNSQVGLIRMLSYAAIALGVIGLIFGIVGFAAARSAKRAVAAVSRPQPPPPPAPTRAPGLPPSMPPQRRP